ncbi:3-hydroxyacyl-ACP dehydratase FabZ [Jeongeupia naejangsanensis]|uniref:3-hydroxyacyl-[acyl-carrier-protein] dehydratase FabZ n=1 Tax=Jeongeupia naejangsanensis TaxID=613195 RepID=A0ABS2BHN8_9NEIS|nr:3-hydroxyacyl-ACP dehydratase FabZ [Jeongeupia naejangsanensis]MBM3114456.1 3-hydroxyacyl-ACP dehydratase FabZ [Jeongeupia naejangsanensis]
MSQVMDVREIMQCLPHRYPFLLLDRVVELEPGKTIKAIKNVTVNEPFFQGHFPQYPVMPGVLILEALAQAAGVLSFKSVEEVPEDSLYLFAGIDNARFKRQVLPGDQLTLCVEIVAHKRGIWKYAAKAFVGSELAAEADLMSAHRVISR